MANSTIRPDFPRQRESTSSVHSPEIIPDHQRLHTALPNWSARIPALDGLRGIAILLVLMRHSIFGLETSSRLWSKVIAAGQLTWSGVDLFFVLSGFLIGGILLDARKSPRYFKTFYLRRVYRIFPLYAALTSLFLLRHLPFRILPGRMGDVSPLSIPWWSYVLMLQNFWMAGLGWYGASAMAVTWSLAVEEQFYLTIPWLIRFVSPRRIFDILVLVVASAPLLRFLLRLSLAHGDFASYILMPCRADALCIGVLCAMLVRNPQGWDLLQKKKWLLYVVVGVLFAGVVFMTHEGYEQLSLPMTIFGYSWLALFYAACLLIAVSGPKGWIQGILCNRSLMATGTLAYCSYLIHLPIITAMRRILETPMSPVGAYFWGGMIGVGLTITIASLSWRFFERPLVRRGHRYSY